MVVDNLFGNRGAEAVAVVTSEERVEQVLAGLGVKATTGIGDGEMDAFFMQVVESTMPRKHM